MDGQIVKESKRITDAVALLPEKIESPEIEAATVELLTAVVEEAKKVKKAQDFFTKPLNAQLKNIREQFKPYLSTLEEAESKARGLVSQWRAGTEVRKAQAAKCLIENAAKAVLQNGDAVAMESLQTAHAGFDAQAPKRIDSDFGSASFRKAWKYEVTDPSAVPDEFWTIDESKVMAAVKNRIAVPGIKAWETETAVIRTNV